MASLKWRVERSVMRIACESYREEGMNDVCFDGAQGLVSDHHEDLLLLLQADEVTEPRLLSQPKKARNTVSTINTWPFKHNMHSWTTIRLNKIK